MTQQEFIDKYSCIIRNAGISLGDPAITKLNAGICDFLDRNPPILEAALKDKDLFLAYQQFDQDTMIYFRKSLEAQPKLEEKFQNAKYMIAMFGLDVEWLEKQSTGIQYIALLNPENEKILKGYDKENLGTFLNNINDNKALENLLHIISIAHYENTSNDKQKLMLFLAENLLDSKILKSLVDLSMTHLEVLRDDAEVLQNITTKPKLVEHFRKLSLNHVNCLKENPKSTLSILNNERLSTVFLRLKPQELKWFKEQEEGIKEIALLHHDNISNLSQYNEKELTALLQSYNEDKRFKNLLQLISVDEYSKITSEKKEVILSIADSIIVTPANGEVLRLLTALQIDHLKLLAEMPEVLAAIVKNPLLVTQFMQLSLENIAYFKANPKIATIILTDKVKVQRFGDFKPETLEWLARNPDLTEAGSQNNDLFLFLPQAQKEQLIFLEKNKELFHEIIKSHNFSHFLKLKEFHMNIWRDNKELKHKISEKNYLLQSLHEFERFHCEYLKNTSISRSILENSTTMSNFAKIKESLLTRIKDDTVLVKAMLQSEYLARQLDKIEEEKLTWLQKNPELLKPLGQNENMLREFLGLKSLHFGLLAQNLKVAKMMIEGSSSYALGELNKLKSHQVEFLNKNPMLALVILDEQPKVLYFQSLDFSHLQYLESNPDIAPFVLDKGDKILAFSSLQQYHLQFLQKLYLNKPDKVKSILSSEQDLRSLRSRGESYLDISLMPPMTKTFYTLTIIGGAVGLGWLAKKFVSDSIKEIITSPLKEIGKSISEQYR